MADKIGMNYAEVEAMAAQCRRVGNKVHAIAAYAKILARELQEGVLVGKPGDTFVRALGQLERRTNLLGDKITEVVHDIEKAMADMKGADSKASAKF
jgi:uncharacterized protein YukE